MKKRENRMILLLSRDNALTQKIQGHLNLEGFVVEPTSSFQEALTRLYQQRTYESILVDFLYDQDNIFEVFRKLKRDPQCQYIPLICIIPKNHLAQQLIAFEMGVDDFISREFSIFELQLKVRSIQRLIHLQKALKEKDIQIENFRNITRIIGTLNHYINNALTPLYALAQVSRPDNPQDAERLKKLTEHTTLFISKVLKTLRTMTQQGELRITQNGVYRDIMFDIEVELQRLMEENLDAG